MTAFLCAYLIYMFISASKSGKSLCFSPGVFDYAVFALTVAYCIAIATGIDHGMAFIGASKLFGLPPFMLIMMQLSSGEKKSFVRLIPISGALSVILCALLSVTPLRDYVFIANRMSGFLGYANTFAFLMLAGLLCEYFYCGKNPLIILILSVGLFWSGSRTVFVMFVIAVIFIAIRHFLIADHYNIKHIILSIILFAIIVIVSLLIPATSGIFKRLTDISVNSSTFQGRLLYMLDALPLIKKFPFGLGSYGYVYAGRITATGLYNVKYIHNSVLQLAADTGILTSAIITLLFFIAWIKKRNFVVLFLFFHTLTDFDLEYVSMLFVLILIMKGYGKSSEAKYPNIPAATSSEKGSAVNTDTDDIFFRNVIIVSIPLCCLLAIAAIPPSLSNMFFLFNDDDAALKVFAANTEAREERMTNSYDLEEIIDDTSYLLSHNEYSAKAYQMAGTLAYLNGDSEQTVYYLSKELELSPYTGSEYRSFASYLTDLATQAKSSGDSATYDYCVQSLLSIYNIMIEKKENISFFGGRISEQPSLYLDNDAVSLLKENNLLPNRIDNAE